MKYLDYNWQLNLLNKAAAYDRLTGGGSLKMFRVVCALNMLSPTTTIQINGEEFLAVWDTGAVQTTVGSRVVNRTDLGPIVGESCAYTASAERIPMKKHRVKLTLPDGFEIPDFLIQYAPAVDGLPHEVIIGMDLISRGRLLIYRTPEGQVLEFHYDEQDLLSGDLDWQAEVE